VGCGLITTLEVHTGTAKWTGYQLLCGFGAGCALQIPNAATQNMRPLEDIPTDLAIVIQARNFGPTVMLGAGNNVMNQKSVTYIGEIGIDGFDCMMVLRASATGFRNVVPKEYLAQMLDAYNRALRQTFYLALPMSCVAVLRCIFTEWKSVKKTSGASGIGGGEEARPVGTVYFVARFDMESVGR
jgi:hypothetical protein